MRIILFLLFFFSVNSSIAADTTHVEKDTTAVHSVKKAVILSAIVPGAGQIYNHLGMPKGKKKAFWKVPLIYSALGASVYFLATNQAEQLNLRQEYTNRSYLSYVSPLEYQPYDDQGILTLYNQRLRWRDLSILAIGAVYALQLLDAGVEAHFVSFDVSEDLSLSIRPTLYSFQSGGLSLSFNFR